MKRMEFTNDPLEQTQKQNSDPRANDQADAELLNTQNLEHL